MKLFFILLLFSVLTASAQTVHVNEFAAPSILQSNPVDRIQRSNGRVIVNSDSTVTIRTGGSDRVTFGATGHQIPAVANAQDLGSAAFPYRTGYFGTSISSAALVATGTGGNGYVQLPNQSSAPGTPTSASRIFIDASNRFSWIGTNGFTRTFDGTANTANRIYVLPDAPGTFALKDLAQTWSADQKIGVGSKVFWMNLDTDASNYERGFARWSANVFQVGNEVAGTGSNRNLQLTASGSVTFAAGGTTTQWFVTSAGGHLQALTDNTYDIGASGATRPRTGYFGTNVSSPIFTSTVATGTAPLTVTSTTPVANLHANPVAYNAAGTQQVSARMVFGSATLSVGTVAVTFSGSSVFTSNATFVCTANDTTAANPVRISRDSASQITFTGTGSDVILYTCVGN